MVGSESVRPCSMGEDLERIGGQETSEVPLPDPQGCLGLDQTSESRSRAQPPVARVQLALGLMGGTVRCRSSAAAIATWLRPFAERCLAQGHRVVLATAIREQPFTQRAWQRLAASVLGGRQPSLVLGIYNVTGTRLGRVSGPMRRGGGPGCPRRAWRRRCTASMPHSWPSHFVELCIWLADESGLDQGRLRRPAAAGLSFCSEHSAAGAS